MSAFSQLEIEQTEGPMSKEPTTFSGLGYGLALTMTSTLAAGFGHGTYAPWRVSSAPFGVFGFTGELVGTLILWTGVGMGFDLLEGRSRRNVIGLVLIGHYCSAVWLLAADNSDLAYLLRGPVSLWLAVGVWGLLYTYLQMIVWRALRRNDGTEPSVPRSAARP
jgi:hypothetical protein